MGDLAPVGILRLAGSVVPSCAIDSLQGGRSLMLLPPASGICVFVDKQRNAREFEEGQNSALSDFCN